jgi:hypothetical protein
MTAEVCSVCVIRVFVQPHRKPQRGGSRRTVQLYGAQEPPLECGSVSKSSRFGQASCSVPIRAQPASEPPSSAFNYMLGNCHGHTITHIKEISDLRLPRPGHQLRQP